MISYASCVPSASALKKEYDQQGERACLRSAQIPSPAKEAKASVRPRTANLALPQYGACSGIAREASAEPTLTIAPRAVGFA
ncbi:hypothetical protein [Paraburkholderia flagellata]|uniref:hypothetical protein n=1 Tax=Paraburkholderia flagellata TaxID=2883241 RepID=UPI003570A487